jgi:transcriptional regulator with GAF, ATPase, and Fis domain
MGAEVCSVYVLRDDGRLELFATEGLNREAVHLTTMRSGEGLVGRIAETAESLALSDAQSHPAFSYKPETGEEIYHSFLGVPVLRGGNTLGVRRRSCTSLECRAGDTRHGRGADRDHPGLVSGPMRMQCGLPGRSRQRP